MKKEIKLDKNPLAVAFGSALKKLRGDTSSSSVAQALGVSNSFIRLLEIGATNIHTSKALKIIEAFSEVEFQPLSKLLIAITITDGFKETTEKYKTGVKDIIDLLKGENNEEDKQIRTLLSNLISVIENHEKGSVSIEQLLEEIGLPEKIKSFLTRNIHGFADSHEKDNSENESDKDKKDTYDLQFDKLLNDTPSIFVDNISLSLQNLKNINPNLFAHDSSEWEKENNQNFVRLIAVIKDFDRILSPENIRGFNYKYLLSDNFKELNYIILNDSNTNDFWEKKFVDALLKRWRQSSSTGSEKTFLKKAIAKIKIKQAKATDADIKSILKTHSNSDSKEILWIFVTSRGNKIGFALNYIANVPQQHIPYGETLTYGESRLKFHLFNSIWRKLK